MTIRDRIEERLNGLSTSQRRIAKVITERYPVNALGGIEDLASAADVSPPTITRFVKHLGFERYADFQRAVRHEVQDTETSPLALLQSYRASPPQKGLLADLSASVANLEVDTVSRAIALAVELIAGTRGRIFALGGRWTSVAAQYLVFQLGTVRGEVHALLPPASGVGTDRLIDLTRRDLMILFDVRRYQEEMFAIAEIVRQRGTRIILLTDPELSPICELSQVTIPVPVATASPLDTLVPTLAVLDAILAQLLEIYGETAIDRIEELEQARKFIQQGAQAKKS